jgi:hypothetical protein
VTRRSSRLKVALLLATAMAATCGCGSTGGARSVASPVALRAQDADSPVTVGVVVSLTSDPGEGSDWSAAAEGARVAAFRYDVGGVEVVLRPENDRGTAAGARDAVRRLVSAHVTGIVMATAGDHLGGALDAARRAKVPVLLPYAAPRSDLPAGVWSTGPDSDQVGAVLSEALVAGRSDSPLLVDAGGATVSELSQADTVGFRPGGDVAALLRRVQHGIRTEGIDSVVVSGPAEAQGLVLAALQGRRVDVPVLLTPEALSPRFAASLVEAGGSLSADVTTVGLPGGDTTALGPGAAGRAATAYYAAARAAADEPRLRDFFDGRAFADVAADADSRSHDAVVALVAAAAEARSNRPADVGTALSHLTVTAADGLAGPDLDFRRQTAVATDDVVVLDSTDQDPGMLPDAGGARIHWFAAPAP